MGRKSNRTARREELLKWCDENVELYTQAIEFCIPLLEIEPIDRVVEELKERRRGYDCLTEDDIVDILKPYTKPHHHLSFFVRTKMSPQVRKMIGELGVDPSEFVYNILEWYREKVYLPEKEKQEQQQDKDNDVYVIHH